MGAEDEGLKIVLSAVQLAAVLRGATLLGSERKLYRLMGTLQLIGSAFELVGGVGLELVPEPTMLTKVGGGILIAHGADSGIAAARQVWTGQPTKDLTQQLGEQLAYGVGASPKVAGWTGIALDVAVPLGVSVAISAERILAVKAGRISLAEHESTATQKLGHTLAEHVGKDEAYLRSRLAQNPRMKIASTFTSLTVAEDAISDTIRGQAAVIKNWAATAKMGGRLPPIKASFAKPIGFGVVRATGKVEQLSGIIIILERTQVDGRIFFIVTAYPAP